MTTSAPQSPAPIEATFSAQCDIRGRFVRAGTDYGGLPFVELGGIMPLDTRPSPQLLRVNMIQFAELLEGSSLTPGQEVRVRASVLTFPTAQGTCPMDPRRQPDFFAETFATRALPGGRALAVWTPEGTVSAVLDEGVLIEGRESLEQWIHARADCDPGALEEGSAADLSPRNAALAELLGKLA